MNTKMRNLLVIGAMLLISALALSAVAAQEATPTVEPPAADATLEAQPEVTPEAAQPDMTAEASNGETEAPRPFLGVSLSDSPDGVTIMQVVNGSAASAAGLQVGDVITAVNGFDVTTVTEAAGEIGALSVGDEVAIDFTRAGEAMSVTAILGAQLEDAQPSMPFEQGRGGRDRMFGFEYNEQDQSWTITELSEDSPLYAAGLRSGDVITAIDGSTYDPMSLFEYVATLGQDATVTLSVTRDGATQDITVSPRDLLSMGFGGMGGFFGRGNGGNDDHGMPFNFDQMMPMLRNAYGNGYLGVAFQSLDADLAGQNNLTITDGALINEVVAGSPAETAGLLAGDVVTAVNGEAVDAEHTLRDRLIAYEPDDAVTLTVLRDGESQDIQVTLAQPQAPEMGQFFNFPGGRGNRGGDQPEATPEALPNT